MKGIKSRGIVIEGGSDNRVWENTVVGFDEGIVIKDSPRSTANRNIVVSRETANIVTEINTFINTLCKNIEQLNLSEESVQEIKSDLQAIKAQVKSPKPKSSIIIACLESVKRVLENAAGSAIGASLVANVDKIMGSIQKIVSF